MDQIEKELFEGLKDEASFETRRDEDIYYQGAFWIKGDSVLSIKRGKFELIGEKLPCTFSGEYLDYFGSQKQLTHKKLWFKYASELSDKGYTYLPRGRVSIYNGVAFIHLNSLFNQPNIVDAVIKMYGIEKLEIEIDLNDTYQGSHYDFQLK